MLIITACIRLRGLGVRNNFVHSFSGHPMNYNKGIPEFNRRMKNLGK